MCVYLFIQQPRFYSQYILKCVYILLYAGNLKRRSQLSCTDTHCVRIFVKNKIVLVSWFVE